ncbi:MAG: hypothetical protein H6555_07405 [Lewinellaceae bacterium]|nr:hypothetical protein [Lewinellaceae bacterium]
MAGLRFNMIQQAQQVSFAALHLRPIELKLEVGFIQRFFEGYRCELHLGFMGCYAQLKIQKKGKCKEGVVGSNQSAVCSRQWAFSTMRGYLTFGPCALCS